MNITTHIHSTSDAITNSSTTIYIWTSKDAIKNTKLLFDQILKAVGSDKSAEDLFNFNVLMPEMDYEDFEERYLEEYPDQTEEDAKEAHTKAVADDNAKPEWWAERSYGDYPAEDRVMVTTKDDSMSLDMKSYFESIFEMDAEYNG